MRTLEIVLGGACMVLAGALAYEASAPLPAIGSDRPTQSGHFTVAPIPAAGAPSPASVAMAQARPLFDPGRQPLGALPEGPVPPSLANVTLVGVMMGGRSRIALLRTGSDTAAASLPLGGAVGSWRIVSIELDRVGLQDGGEHYELMLPGRGGKRVCNNKNNEKCHV
ncbi:MAG: hypothetical protein KGJ78_07275 [Alphaproteobacteria bacterium]|nr:hypothetical protein [Alphaproteobacteria bacterium]